MIRLISFFLLSLFFNVELTGQQSLGLGWSLVKGNDDPGQALSLTWYQTDGLWSGTAFHVNYMDTEKDISFVTERNRILQFEVAKRWNRTIGGRLQINAEMGLSGMAINSSYAIGEYYLTCDCLCGTGKNHYAGISTNEMAILNYNYKEKEHYLHFFPGANVSVGLDVMVTKNFSLGLHSTGSSYYTLSRKKFIHYWRYGLNAGFWF